MCNPLNSTSTLVVSLMASWIDIPVERKSGRLALFKWPFTGRVMGASGCVVMFAAQETGRTSSGDG